LNRIVLALFAVLLCSSFLFAQTNTTSLSGVVIDPMGAVVPGVSVSISNAASGSVQRTQTKAKGEFSFEQIPPGTYEVKVVAAGFSELVERVQLLVSTPLSLAFKLTVGTNEVVNVETNLAELNTTDGTLGKAFNSAQVQNLPYLANNVTYLLSLQPGVLALDLSVRLDNGKTIELDPERARHIDYGYTVETAKQVSADRILLTGESSQLAEQQATLAKLTPNVREVVIYTSDSRDNGIGKELELSQEGFSIAPSLSNASEPSGPSIEVEGHGIGL
jgi:hypothetical protein